SQYKHHDYYFLAMIPSIGLGIFCTFQLLSALSISKWLKRGVYSYVLVILILSFKSTRQGLTERKVHKVDLFSSIEHKLQASDEVLDSLGSKRSDMLFILGDYSINGGLRLTKRKGWSRGELNEESRKIIDDVVGFGAKYLINSEPKKYNSTQFGEVVYTNEFIEIVKF
ncbi:MAG: hypothetical protein KJ941_09055, partial [Bacteroidetes bacterium]|nr:hypothetical protein [Bacteroidota bacterium]